MIHVLLYQTGIYISRKWYISNHQYTFEYTGKTLKSYGCSTFYPCKLGAKSYELENHLSIFFYAKDRERYLNKDYEVCIYIYIFRFRLVIIVFNGQVYPIYNTNRCLKAKEYIPLSLSKIK